MDDMEFTEREKKQLREWGKSDEDIRYYNQCLCGVKYILVYSDKDISARTAKNILGWKTWLTGIERCIRLAGSLVSKNEKTGTFVSFSYRLQ